MHGRIVHGAAETLEAQVVAEGIRMTFDGYRIGVNPVSKALEPISRINPPVSPLEG